MRIAFTVSPQQVALLEAIQGMFGLPSVSATAKHLMINGTTTVQPALSSFRSGQAASEAANSLPGVMMRAFQQHSDEDEVVGVENDVTGEITYRKVTSSDDFSDPDVGPGPSSTRSSASPVPHSRSKR